MKKSDSFVLKEVAGSNVLVPFGDITMDFRGVITLNETAKFLWEKIDCEFDVESLTELLCQAYEVETETAKISAEKFINSLKEVGAVE